MGIFDHIRGDRYEESDTENQICFILAQVFLGDICAFLFLSQNACFCDYIMDNKINGIIKRE